MEGGAINQRPYEQQLKYSNMNERWTSSLLYHLRCGSPRTVTGSELAIVELSITLRVSSLEYIRWILRSRKFPA